MRRWSDRERAQLTTLLRTLERMHRKAATLRTEFSGWSEEITEPLDDLNRATWTAANAIYRVR